MELRLLGPVEALIGGHPVRLGGRQRTSLLALLGIARGRAVSTDHLVDELWGHSPPENARKTVQAHIAHLRRALNVDGEVLAPSDQGYVLNIEAESTDVGRFDRLLEEARSIASEHPNRAAEKFDEALALFRGAPLEGLADGTNSLRVEASRLAELRLSAMEDRFDVVIANGGAQTVTADVERLLVEQPFRERLWGLLMLALYRSGRQSEALTAYSRIRNLLAEELGLEPSSGLADLEQRILDHDPSLYHSSPLSTMAGPADAKTVTRNPFKGLRPFDEADAADFFGREALVRRLLERVEVRANPPLLVLTGPSGSGKSSVIRAGLIPELRERGLAVATMFPGSDPFSALAKALTEVTGEPVEGTRDTIDTGDPLAGEQLILVIDQFEELFIASEAGEYRRFLNLITDKISSRSSEVRIVITLRADQLHRAMTESSFSRMLEAGLVLVTPLTDNELRSVIIKPLARVGVGIELELVSQLISEVSTLPNALPLLQFVLADMFDRRRTDILTLDSYEAVGGVSGALIRRAEDIYHRFDENDQQAARQVLLRLVTTTEDGQSRPRRLTRDELGQLPFDERVLTRVLEEFGSHRLITFDQDIESGAAVVEIAHESLLTHWPRLRTWIDSARGDLKTHDVLASATQEWVFSNRDASYLLRGARLHNMERWEASTGLVLTASEARFLSESRNYEDLTGRRRANRRRAVFGALAAAVVVSTLLAVLARGQALAADRNAGLAQARRLAAAAIASIDEDPQRAILLGLASAEVTGEAGQGVIRETQEALHQAILASRLSLMITPVSAKGDVSTVATVFSPDGTLLATGGSDGRVRIYEAKTGREVEQLAGHEGAIVDVKWSSEGSQLFTFGEDGNPRMWDVSAASQVRTFGPVGSATLIGSVSPDDARVAASTPTSVVVWDVKSGAEQLEVELGVPGIVLPVGVAFDPVTGDRLAVALDGPVEFGGGVTILDSHTGERMVDITPEDGVCELRWSPDGTRIATASGDTTGAVWDATTGEQLTTFAKHHSFLCTVDFSPDGTEVVTGGDDGTARVWNADTGEERVLLAGPRERVAFVAFSPDGQRVVTSSRDDHIRIWDVTREGQRESVTVADPTVALRASYNPDGSEFLTSSFDGNAYLWDAATGRLVRTFQGHTSWIYAASFSPDGDRVATAGRDSTARVWDAATGRELARFKAPAFATAVAFDPSGDLVIVGTIAGTADVWNPTTGESTELLSFEDMFGQIFGVAFSPDESLLAAAGESDIALWDADRLERLQGISISEEQFHGAESLEFDSTGETLLSAHRDGAIRIWDVETRTLSHQLLGHQGLVWDATFSPDDSLVASAGFDGTIRLWNATEENELLSLSDAQAFTSVDFDPTGEHLLVSGDFGARVLVVRADDLLQLAQSRLLRWWTPEECLEYLESESCPPAPAELED